MTAIVAMCTAFAYSRQLYGRMQAQAIQIHQKRKAGTVMAFVFFGDAYSIIFINYQTANIIWRINAHKLKRKSAI